jgi:hypothetical protein
MDPKVIISGIVAVVLVLGTIVLVGLDRAIPDVLIAADGAAVGWLFGASTANAPLPGRLGGK